MGTPEGGWIRAWLLTGLKLPTNGVGRSFRRPPFASVAGSRERATGGVGGVNGVGGVGGGAGGGARGGPQAWVLQREAGTGRAESG